jgi:hypothetical protein
VSQKRLSAQNTTSSKTPTFDFTLGNEIAEILRPHIHAAPALDPPMQRDHSSHLLLHPARNPGNTIIVSHRISLLSMRGRDMGIEHVYVSKLSLLLIGLP